MGNFIKANLLSKRVHNLGKFNRVPIVFRQVLFQEEECE
jgi:hypothetical protein